MHLLQNLMFLNSVSEINRVLLGMGNNRLVVRNEDKVSFLVSFSMFSASKKSSNITFEKYGLHCKIYLAFPYNINFSYALASFGPKSHQHTWFKLEYDTQFIKGYE